MIVNIYIYVYDCICIMYILILVCESLMSKICKALQHHLKNTIKHATWGVSACRFFAGMTFQRERQKSFGSFGIYPLVICYIAIEHGNL